ncbi:MAG: 2-oxoglutarate carboxylase small subunit [Pseudomonadota bacterium]|jgi:urea carboxylase
MLTKVLIANRGAIACRIIRTLRSMGIRSVAIYSEADASAAHVRQADEAYCVGPAAAAQSYLQAAKILEMAQQCGAQAIHPGYGFLSENAAFAQACEAAGIAFVGPSAEHMRAFGLKHTARALAQQNQVPLLPGSEVLLDAEHARREAHRIGYPVMLKSTAGGGGIGMRLVHSEAELGPAYESVTRLAQANFKDGGVFLEKFVARARHIEVQIFGDGQGGVIALGERDCSVQRRHQKVIEETPAPGLTDAQREGLQDCAVRLAKAVRYRSAGTVEFVYDADTQDFYFLEVNTRLQVEHGVTEQVCGVDLVRWMVELASGELPALDSIRPTPKGASIQVRLYAEDPAKQFQPCAGLLTEVSFPQNARVDGWVEAGTEVPAWYDPMLAKIIVTADDRAAALLAMEDALRATRVAGIQTNLSYLRAVIQDPVIRSGQQITAFLNTFVYTPHTIEVLEPGVQTTVQDWPGRLGHWDVGVPPSGPMDALAHRIANRLVGNTACAAGLECTLSGPTLKLNVATTVAVTGAPTEVFLNDVPMPMWASFDAPSGAVLRIGRCQSGSRICVAFGGGLSVPDYLNSKSTFTLGQFGGHGGRCLRAADTLELADPSVRAQHREWPVEFRPAYRSHWDVAVLYGPHGAPEFLTPDDVAMFFSTDWAVHYNSSRTGVRLIGPKPQWARLDGAEAGLHPSNIHDNAYAVGAIDFTGDMPVILGPDGPSLGGFVCPAVVVNAELWKLGQLRPGDTVRFHRVSLAQALSMQQALERCVDGLDQGPCDAFCDDPHACPSPVLHSDPSAGETPQMVIRQAGDRYVLIEFGDMVLDLELRMRVQALMESIKASADQDLRGSIVDMTPGIRSLQIHWNPQRLAREHLLEKIIAIEAQLPSLDAIEVPSRVVHLPLSWDDPQTRLAIEKYTQSVRPDAPWCPSNIEFIRRINGLASLDDVYQTVFDAHYLVLGLGDVYLGAPVATPLDPRHRLVTTKYNPARTWTPENAVGIGGAYLCVYGMEGPGGYQFVGRTLQMWNRWKHGPTHAPFEQPWLLRFFDQIRFYPVSHEALDTIRADFPHGRYPIRIEETTFSLKRYRQFLAEQAVSIQDFKHQQQAAFEAERQRWLAQGQLQFSDDHGPEPDPRAALDVPPGAQVLTSSVPGSLWKVCVEPGQRVQAGDVLMVVESMKMEFNIVATHAGRVHQVLGREGTPVSAGQHMLVLDHLEKV